MKQCGLDDTGILSISKLIEITVVMFLRTVFDYMFI